MPSFSVESLERDIRQHQRLYDQGTPEISDDVFDNLVEMLRRKAPNSPVLNEIGTKPTSKKITHIMPMLSLEKCYDARKLRSWLAATPGPWFVEPKYDGVAVSLRYHKGRLVAAATRGDGYEGQDITTIARHVIGVMPQLPEWSFDTPGSLEVRGEIVMHRATFDQHFAAKFANPRNLVAGLLGANEPDVTALGCCDFYAYDCVVMGPDPDEYARLFKTTFKKSIVLANTHDPDLVLHTIQRFDRTALPMECDGIVVKASDLSVRKKLGSVAHHPRWAIAWKFQGESGQATLHNVEWEVSRTGVLTPVAVFDPVELSGVSITRATLHNLHRFDQLQLSAGDTLLITRRGGVIPHVEGVSQRARHSRPNTLQTPAYCPACGVPTKPMAGRLRLVCTSSQCPGATRAKLLHWCHTTGMLGWGPTTVLAVETIGVRNIPDLYRLKNDSALSSLVGEKTAATLIAEVDKTRRLNPEVFLGALGIEGLGVETAKKILSVYLWNDPENHKLLPARLATIPGIGETTARTITGGLRNYEHLIDELLAHIDLTPSSTTPQGSSSGPFVGKKVVFTGALTAMERSTAQELVRQAGGETPTSLTKQTDVLVVGDESRDRNTTKLDKARKYGTEIIDETEFARRLAEC